MTDSARHPTDKSLAAVAARLGPGVFERRLATQVAHSARYKNQGGLHKAQRLLSVRRMVMIAVRLVGLHRRARRNFLDVQVVEQRWRFPSLPAGFDGFRILQLSDLHLDLDPALGPVVEALVRATPHDAAVITGDFRNLTDSDFSAAMAATRDVISSLAPDRFGILGNHDFIEKVPELERAGLPILLNESTKLDRGGDVIWVSGVDDPHFFRTHDLTKVAAQPPNGAFRILLAHSPEVADEAAALGFDWMLAGHTHGGQICLPGGRAVVVPVKRLARDLLRGPWKREGMQGYTSPGTGSCGVPARFNCPPEITLHVLE